jgi:hypothetical protein
MTITFDARIGITPPIIPDNHWITMGKNERFDTPAHPRCGQAQRRRRWCATITVTEPDVRIVAGASK